MIRRNKHGICIIDGQFSRAEILLLKEKDPVECGNKYRIDRDNRTDATNKRKR